MMDGGWSLADWARDAEPLWIAQWLARATLLMALGWGTARLFRNGTAATRHGVWRATLAALLALPLLMMALPSWGELPAPSWWTLSGAEGPAEGAARLSTAAPPSQVTKSWQPTPPANAEPAAPAPPGQPSLSPLAAPDSAPQRTTSGAQPAAAPASTMPRRSARPFNWNGRRLLTAALVCYGLGMLAALAPLAVGALGASLLRRRATPLRSDAWCSLLDELRGALGVRTRVRLLRAVGPVGPCVAGLLRPSIVLPANCDDWSDERRRIVLLHELAHVARHDLLWQVGSRLCAALHWFHPLAWHAVRRLRLESEHCCDELVLAAGVRPSTYAQQLLELARETSAARGMGVAATMARRSDLPERLRALLDPRRRPAPTSWGARVALGTLGTLALVGAASAGRIVIRDSQGRVIQTVEVPPGASVEVIPDTERHAPEQIDRSLSPEARRALRQRVQADEPPGERYWSQLGGDAARRNVSAGQWAPHGDWTQQLAWRTPLGKRTYGGVVIGSGRRLLIGTSNPRHDERDVAVLMCFHAATGELMWQHTSEKLATGRVHDWPGAGITSTPLMDLDRIWYVTNRCELVCLDLEGFGDAVNDGAVQDEPAGPRDPDIVWRLDMLRELGVSPFHASSSSPCTDGTRLFLCTSNGVDESHQQLPAPGAPSFLCVDRTTGRVLWSSDAPGANILHGQWSSPAFGVIDGRPQVVFPGGDGWLYAFAPEGDGQGRARLLWKFDCNPKDAVWQVGGRSRRNSHLTTPTIHEGRVYVATGQDPEHGEGPGELWCIAPNNVAEGADVSATLVVDRDGQVVPPRRLVALDRNAGEREVANPSSAVAWRYEGADLDANGRLDFAENLHRTLGGVAIARGLLVVADLSGVVHCLDASTGRANWTYDLQAAVWGAPQIVDQAILVGNEDGSLRSFALDRRRRELGVHELPGAIYQGPLVVGDRAYVVAGDELLCLE